MREGGGEKTSNLVILEEEKIRPVRAVKSEAIVAGRACW